MIVVEERVRELIDTLPLMLIDGVEFKVVYDFGHEDDLTILLKQEIQKYPLIWLETGFTESHNTQKTEVDVTLSFKLATSGFSSTLLNQVRLRTTFKDVLFPLLDNLEKCFKRANTVLTIESTSDIEKFYNYGQDKESETTAIWDALTFDVDLKFNNDCLRPFSYA